MFKEFKEFALKGNVVDMAIGIVIGAAFGTIVTSFVNDILMPPIGVLLGNVDFANMFITLKAGTGGAGGYGTLAQAKAAGAVTLNYGMFINALISFLIIATSLFFVVKGMNNLKKKEPEAEPDTKECPYCFEMIKAKSTRCAFCTAEL